MNLIVWMPRGSPGLQDILLVAGELTEDDGSGGVADVLLVDADDRTVAERFAKEDPFTKAGLLTKVIVLRWSKAFFDGECLLPNQ